MAALEQMGFDAGFDKLFHCLTAQLVEYRGLYEPRAGATVGESGDTERGVAQFGELALQLVGGTERVARGLLGAHHCGRGLATIAVDKGEPQSVGGIRQREINGDGAFGGAALQLLGESLVVVAPQGRADGEAVGHAVRAYGRALHMVHQESFELPLGIEEAEAVARGESFGSGQGDGVATQGGHLADALAERFLCGKICHGLPLAEEVVGKSAVESLFKVGGEEEAARARRGGSAGGIPLHDVVEQLSPERRFYTDVKKALNDVELLDSLAVGSEIFSNLLCSCVGSFVGCPKEREYNNGEIAFKLLACGLGYNSLWLNC